MACNGRVLVSCTLSQQLARSVYSWGPRHSLVTGTIIPLGLGVALEPTGRIPRDRVADRAQALIVGGPEIEIIIPLGPGAARERTGRIPRDRMADLGQAPIVGGEEGILQVRPVGQAPGRTGGGGDTIVPRIRRSSVC
jgi:hypothetical protein